MQPINLQRITKLYLSTVFLAGAISAAAANSDMHLTGLALHQETGRNIYLGGIFFDQHVPKPQDLVNASGPKMMEYRVVARRTSIRSLLGGILLQSELAKEQAPDEAVSKFANDILSSVKGSLYAGDSFEILLNENDETVAYLNGHELARIDDGTVADYILVGWIGDQGPSTTFRNSITADKVDPDLLAILQTNAYSSQRGNEVASWLATEQARPADTASTSTDDTAVAAAIETITEAMEPAEEELAAIPSPSIESALAVTSQDPVESAADIQGQGVVSATAALINTDTPAANEPLITQPRPGADQQPSTPDPVLAIEEGTQVASLIPTAGLLGQDEPEEGIAALNVKDYSQRLARFNTNLIRRVYGEIKYPRQAVRRNLQGRLELDVTLREDGELVDITVAQSSGFKILDKAAVKAARKALAAVDPTDLDPVAIAEYGGDSDKLIVPIPVQFLLTE